MDVLIEATPEVVTIDGVPAADPVSTLASLLQSGAELWTTTHRQTVTALHQRGIAIRGIRDLAAARRVCGHVGTLDHLRTLPEWSWVIPEARFIDLWLHRQFQGWALDTNWLERRRVELTARIAELNGDHGLDLNAATVEQLGVESRRLDDLRRRPSTPFIAAVIEAGEAKADLTKADELLRHVVAGRIHPTIDAAGAGTGRMTVSGPALHNMRGALRPALTADPGQTLVGADWSACEMRVAAWLSGDDKLRADCAAGDLYAAVAERLGITRQAAKLTLLAPLYGQGDAALGENLSITTDEAAEVRAQVFGQYRQLQRWVKATNHEDNIALRSGVGQRRIALPAPRLRVNYTIQGTARDLLVQAVLRIVDDPELGVGAVWMAVHDELTISVPEDRAEAGIERLRAAMHFDLDGIALTADPVHLGSRWGHP